MSDEFKILSDREHMLMRPDMYIGSINEENITLICNFEHKTLKVVPGLLKIINEIIDNSVDEAIRTNFKHANKIDVDIKHDSIYDEWSISVQDNGRGIPSVKYDGIFQAEAAWTRAKSGTSFNDNRQTIGMNGVGSFATNCFSKKFVGTSCDGKTQVIVSCEDSCYPTKIKVDERKCSKNGTQISFSPDLSLFKLTTISDAHLEIIEDRLINLSICYPNIKFKFNGKTINPGSLNSIAKKFDEDALAFNFDNIKVIVGPSGDDAEFRFLSYINGLNLKNGGSHIDYLVGQIASELQPQIKKKWKIDVMPNQIKQHLLFASWADGFNNPKFDSQSKERLTNSVAEVREFFKDVDCSKIAKKIISTESIINPMVEAILYKKQLADKRAANAALKKAAKKKIAKHLVATDKDPEARILHIAEGESAMSSLITCRDPKIHGAYPLRGKVVNTFGISPAAWSKNAELLELVSILGLDINSSSINEDPTELFEITHNGETFVVAEKDIIITKDGQRLNVSDLLNNNTVETKKPERKNDVTIETELPVKLEEPVKKAVKKVKPKEKPVKTVAKPKITTGNTSSVDLSSLF